MSTSGPARPAGHNSLGLRSGQKCKGDNSGFLIPSSSNCSGAQQKKPKGESLHFRGVTAHKTGAPRTCKYKARTGFKVVPGFPRGRTLNMCRHVVTLLTGGGGGGKRSHASGQGFSTSRSTDILCPGPELLHLSHLYSQCGPQCQDREVKTHTLPAPPAQ